MRGVGTRGFGGMKALNFRCSSWVLCCLWREQDPNVGLCSAGYGAAARTRKMHRVVQHR
jgi:hypothetical protein